MTDSASVLSATGWKQLDDRLRKSDEDRWLSSRYAPAAPRRAMIALYLLNFELARVRLVVSEAGLGAIRFQWWRDAIDAMPQGGTYQHDVALALQEVVRAGRISTQALLKLVDGHEVAFECSDRRLEPEAWLAATAAKVLAPAHGWGPHIIDLAPHVAALRRGEKVGYGPVAPKVPADIRPAIAHFRLRRLRAAGRGDAKFRRRLCVLAAILTGAV